MDKRIGVLIIGKEDRDLRGTILYLIESGYAVVRLDNARDGIVELDKGIYQIVLLDESLPYSEETCHNIREIFHLPVILLADRFTDDYWRKVASTEADPHVGKKADGYEYVAWIKAVLRRFNRPN